MSVRRNRLRRAFQLITLVVLTNLLLTETHGAKRATRVAIIVNSANTYEGDAETMKNLAKQLYLKERTSWPSKVKCKAFGRPNSSPEHQVFRDGVLGMTQAKLTRHWLALKQRSGETAPRAVKSDKVLIKFVQKYKGGLGIVDEDAAKEAAGKVKILFTLP